MYSNAKFSVFIKKKKSNETAPPWETLDINTTSCPDMFQFKREIPENLK